MPHGGFELGGPLPAGGADVSSLPGWTVRATALDAVVPRAMIVSSDKLADVTPPRPIRSRLDGTQRNKSRLSPGIRPHPGLERHVLRLEIKPRREKDEAGNPIPPPAALERAVVAVESPAVSLAPGTLVRVSFGVKVPNPILSTADGLLIFDDAGWGTALRPPHSLPQLETISPLSPGTAEWRNPGNGRIATGIGVAFVDNVKIEPMTTRR